MHSVKYRISLLRAMSNILGEQVGTGTSLLCLCCQCCCRWKASIGLHQVLKGGLVWMEITAIVNGDLSLESWNKQVYSFKRKQHGRCKHRWKKQASPEFRAPDIISSLFASPPSHWCTLAWRSNLWIVWYLQLVLGAYLQLRPTDDGKKNWDCGPKREVTPTHGNNEYWENPFP